LHLVGHRHVNDESLELLVQSAKAGQVDPWNVDIVALTEAYLAAVTEKTQSIVMLTAQQIRQEQWEGKKWLAVTGKTLLYLAILLRMKSDLLSGLDPFAPIIEDADFSAMDWPEEDAFAQGASGSWASASAGKVISLDTVLQRRNSAKQPRIRPVTLDDLISELKRYEVLEQERQATATVERLSERLHRGRDLSKLTTEDITEGLAHEEDLESATDRISRLLREAWDVDPKRVMTLSEVSEQSGCDAIETFLAFLFLEAAASVEIIPSEDSSHFYAENLTIRLPDVMIDPTGPTH
jgi:segregation and condensation protein A